MIPTFIKYQAAKTILKASSRLRLRKAPLVLVRKEE